MFHNLHPPSYRVVRQAEGREWDVKKWGWPPRLSSFAGCKDRGKKKIKVCQPLRQVWCQTADGPRCRPRTVVMKQDDEDRPGELPAMAEEGRRERKGRKSRGGAAGGGRLCCEMGD